jgi:ABC-type multidrug transport system ATPase subunit
MYCLETDRLSHRYPGGDLVLDELALRVPQASIYGFLGPNGAGKTTSLRLILGLIRQQQGRISVFGKCFDRHRVDSLRQIGSLIESPSLYEHLSATENLALLRTIYRLPKSRMAETLALVGLQRVGSKRVGQFSLGMKQRLSIAVALLHSPRLLILDEPTNGLDPHGIVEMRELLIRLNREDGISILISSHLLSELQRWVSHLGILHQGRLRFQGSLDELKQQHRQHQGAITLASSDDRRALQIIRESGVDARIGDGHVCLPAMPKAQRAALNRRLLESGVEVHAISEAETDLEAIFMNLVGN